MVPFPSWQDRLILHIGTFDSADLWNDVIGSLFAGTPAAESEGDCIIARYLPYGPSRRKMPTDFWEISHG